jgi:hypothetical protein
MSYFHASGASEAEAEEILNAVPKFAIRVEAWLRTKHPDLAG